MLPQEFLKARLGLIDERLKVLPYISLGSHSGNPILREYYMDNGKRKQHEYRISGTDGQAMLHIYNERSDLIDARRMVMGAIKSVSSRDIIDTAKIETELNGELWDSLQQKRDDSESEGAYIHKGIRMRSRGEVLIAQVLDSFGMIYKYEPKIIIGNETYYPDFAVMIPEFNRFFFIEFLGMLDDKNYAMKNGIKLANYLNSGLVINRDILLFCGTKSTMVSVDEVAMDIIALIKKYCGMYSCSGL